MNIIEHYSDKINGVLSSFDRIIINGYILFLQNPRQFLFYLISNSVKLLDFHSFAKSQTDSLFLHIDSYANDCGVDIYLLLKLIKMNLLVPLLTKILLGLV